MNPNFDHFMITNGPLSGQKIALSNVKPGEAGIVIGRMTPADLLLDGDSVSRRHARISLGESGYIVEDLGSSNGTFVNDERIQAPCLLRDGDRVKIGPHEITLVIAPPAPAPVEVSAPVRGATERLEAANTLGKTIALDELPPLPPPLPPQLVVTASGQEPVVYTLTAPRMRIGRLPDNDIVIQNRYVSRYHAELEQRGADYYLIPSATISNPLLMDGKPVMEATRLHHGAKIRVGGLAPGELVSLDYLSPFGEAEAAAQQTIQFVDNRVMTIGRGPDNDITLPAPMVSRYHAEVEKIGQRYRVRDLRSSNGTFVNGKSIDGETWVQAGDTIQVGPYRFVVGEARLSQFDESGQGVRVEAFGLNKWVSKKLNIIQDISLVFQPREFIVVVGQSGGGKSSLVDAIAGYRPATHGKVMINDTIDVYREFDAIRNTIGYVPQKDIIHMELTVFQALDYAAQLRMPADTSEEERLQRVDEVMQDLDLAHRKDTPISELSGGQQKRVSIGVELITKPGLFFLDEPTSGLDPGMESELMQLMRRLADQGRTIILITHATKNVMLADKVVFLARGGYLTWFGPPEEALAFFNAYRTERDQRSNSMQFDHIYNLLAQPELGSGKDWAERFQRDPAFQKYIVEPLKDKAPTQNMDNSQEASRTLSQRKQISALRQFLILSGRNLRIIARDRFSLALMILTAPLMASLDFVLASGVGRNPLGFNGGDFNSVIITLIVLTNTSILVGGLALMRELVKEREIYKRERMVNLRLSSYIFSKIWFALLLAVYQATCFTVIRYLAFDMPGGIEAAVLNYITIFLLIIAGMMMGLFSSAVAPNANAAPLLMISFVIPQMVLSGALVPLPALARAPASSSWAFQAAIGISGAGSDVDRDACWDLSKEEQDELTLDEKDLQCNCMGKNALHEESCGFPGLGEYYDEAIDQSDPVKPVDPGAEPAAPVFPPEPAQPADPNNLLALQLYLQELTEYNEKVSHLRDEYEKEIDTWREAQETYKDQLETYQEDLTDLEVKRAIAIGSAESSIRRFKDDYGWTFLDKTDRRNYLRTLFGTWGAQLAIILILFIGTVFVQKRRDVT